MPGMMRNRKPFVPSLAAGSMRETPRKAIAGASTMPIAKYTVDVVTMPVARVCSKAGPGTGYGTFGGSDPQSSNFPGQATVPSEPLELPRRSGRY